MKIVTSKPVLTMTKVEAKAIRDFINALSECGELDVCDWSVLIDDFNGCGGEGEFYNTEIID